MKYKSVIFDLDGTVLDTLEDLHASVAFALDTHSLPTRTVDEVRRFVGNGIRNLIKRSVPEGTVEETEQKVFDSFVSHYMEHCDDRTRPYPGVCSLLEKLTESGVKTAVLSNKADAAVKELCRLHFEDVFTVAAGEREGVRRKPAPDAVYSVLEELGVGINDSVYVGDSEVDVETARNAGIELICVDWGFRPRETLEGAGAKLIVSSVGELEKYLL